MLHAHARPTVPPTIAITKNGRTVTELDPGEADLLFTSLADLRTSVYDLDVDVATALALPSIEDLDTLLEQLRDTIRRARTECGWPSCVTVGVGASGYCPEHSGLTRAYDGLDEDDLGNVDEDGWDRTPGKPATFVGLSGGAA